MARPNQRPARSLYRGIRVSITQRDLETPCLVTLATKQLNAPWDQWDLLFPAIRVPVDPRDSDGYQGILRTVVRAVEELIRVDSEYM
jgi:hypothetical protein